MLTILSKIRSSISLRVLLYLSVPGIIVFLVFAAVSLSYVRQAAERDYLRNAAGIVKTVKALIRAEDIAEPEHFQPTAERIAATNDHIIKLHLHLPANSGAYTAASTHREEIGGMSSAMDAKPLKTGKDVATRQGDVVEVHTPLFRTGKPVAVVGIYLSTKEEQARLAELTRRLMALGALVAAFMTAAVYFTLTRLVLRPLAGLEVSTKQLAMGHYDPVRIDRADEIGHLAKHFNIMLETIAEKEDETRTLYARLEKSYKQVRSQAITDELTGLYNTRYLRARLDEEVSRSKRNGLPVTLAFVDIDNFKIFNDGYGHHAGDTALQAVSRVIKGQIRAGDLAARYGGEELVIIFPETTSQQTAAICERIREEVNTLVFKDGGRQCGRLSVSIGIATFPLDGETGKLLIMAADKRMYQGKASGKNQVVAPSNSLTTAAAPKSPA